MVRGHQACSSGSPQARCNSVANPLPVCAGWRAKQDDEARNQLSRHCETWQKHKGRGLPKGHAQKGRGSQVKTCEKCRQRRIRCKHMRATGRGTGEASGRKALTLTDMFRSTKQPLMLPQSHFEARHHKRSVDGGGAVARSSHVDGACGKDLQASASLKLLLIAAAGAVGWSNDREKFVPFEACHANTPNASAHVSTQLEAAAVASGTAEDVAAGLLTPALCLRHPPPMCRARRLWSAESGG